MNIFTKFLVRKCRRKTIANKWYRRSISSLIMALSVNFILVAFADHKLGSLVFYHFQFVK